MPPMSMSKIGMVPLRVTWKLGAEQRKILLGTGFLDSPSARTGQRLRVGKAVLTEQLEDPEGHDLLKLVRRITCPVLIIHGENDPTVPAACATQLGDAIGENAQVKVIPGANHVFNTVNPLPPESKPSPQLAGLLDAVVGFARVCCRRSAA